MRDDPNNNDCEGNFNRLPIFDLEWKGLVLVCNTYYSNIIDSFNMKTRFALSADFIRVQFSNLKTEMM